MGIIRELATSYNDHDGMGLSANISFYAILSLIPLLMIMMSVAGYVLGSSQGLFDKIVLAVTEVLPQGGDQLTANLKSIINGRSKVGGAGVLVLLFIASFLFSSIEHSMDRIFQSEKKRNFFHSRLISILLVFGVTFLLFFPTMVQFFEHALMRFNITIPLSNIATSRTFFAVLAIFSFTAAVIVIPAHRVKFRYAIVGGAFFAAGLGIAKFVFKWYIARSFARYNLIYGSLAVLVVAVLWIFYLANVLLIASELVAVLQRRYSQCQVNGVNGNRG